MVSGDIFADVTFEPIVRTMTSIVTPMDIVNLFATAVGACIGLVLTWFICKWLYRKFIQALRGGRA